MSNAATCNTQTLHTCMHDAALCHDRCLGSASFCDQEAAAHRFMNLDRDTCSQAPFVSVPMLSAADYVASLRLPSGFDWRSALQTLIVRLGFPLLLPATDFVPGGGGGSRDADPFAALGGSGVLYSIMRDALSPLHLFAIGAPLQRPDHPAPARACSVTWAGWQL
jgi:hypothetical protein